MRLLFDQNLSPKLPLKLNDLFPGSLHVQSVGLGNATDDEVWEYAKLHSLTVISKDQDYSQLSVLEGSPPKVIWLLLGNCSTNQVESLLRNHFPDVQAFETDPSATVLAIG